MEEGEMQFRSLKRLVFPGGVVVPVGSVGRVISPPRVSPVVVSWNVEVSGWKMALEVLRSFIGENPRRRAVAKKSRMAGDDVFGAAKGVSRPGEEELRLEIEDLGMGDIGEEAVLDILHLFGSLLSSGPDLAAHLIDHLSIESASDETDPPSDLVQILFTILEQSLTSSSRPNSKLVSVTLGLLTSLLPAFPGRVWTYLRSSSLLFSNGRRSASTASVLASERSIGTYGMTIALLDLIFALFLEAQRTHFVAEPDFLKVKADVLSRALGLIHAEVWSGYTGWKYTSLRERFDIGRKITILYDEILKDPTLAPSSPSDASLGPLSILQTFLAEAFILNTTSLTLSPIVSTLVIGRGLVSGLYASGRVFEAPKAERLIEVTLRLARHVLALKRRLNVTRIVALEQLFFDRSSTSRTAGSRQLKAEIVDVVANFVVSPTSSLGIASEAVRLLSTLCGSLSTATSDTPPSIVGHLDDAVATTKAFLSVLGDPYQDRDLRRSIWNLLGVLVSTQIGWAALFIDLDHQGKLMSSLPLSGKGKKKETDQKDETNAIGLAQQMISIWSELWDSDPALLSSILRFVDLAWQHFPDHSSLATLRSDPAFWEKVFALALRSKLTPSEIDLSDEAFTSGPVPQDVDEDEAERDVRAISYRNLSRAHAIHLFALDLEIMGRRTGGKAGKDRKPEQASFAIIEKLLLRQKHRLLGGATLRYLRNSCDPELHEEVHKSISDAYPGLLVEKVRVKLPLEEREFGHDYLCVHPFWLFDFGSSVKMFD
jgi:nuclear pore complex protein Nup188